MKEGACFCSCGVYRVEQNTQMILARQPEAHFYYKKHLLK